MNEIAGTDYLLVIAQVSITLVGFTGIVIVFGERAVGSWNSSERQRLSLLVRPGLVVFFASLLPVILSASDMDPQLNWRICSGILLLFIVILLHGF